MRQPTFSALGAAAASLTVQATAEGLYVHQMAGIQVEKARQDLIPCEGLNQLGPAQNNGA